MFKNYEYSVQSKSPIIHLKKFNLIYKKSAEQSSIELEIMLEILHQYFGYI